MNFCIRSVKRFCSHIIYEKHTNLNLFLGEAREHEDDEIEIYESLQFDFNTLQNATNDFSDSNKLGHGGFGAVYRVR